MTASMAQGAVHISAVFADGAVTLDGTASRVGYLNGGVLDWWFRGTATQGGRTADVLLYRNLDDADLGVLWLRDDAGFGGRPWLKFDPKTLDPGDPALAGKLRALAGEHFGLSFNGPVLGRLLPWLAGTEWALENGGTATGPFRERHRGLATVRYDLKGHERYPGTCRLWLTLDHLPVEQQGCIGPATDSVVWSDYGTPGTGYVPPPADQVTDIATLLG